MSDWGQASSDFSGEPRNVFVSFLIWNIKSIEDRIYFYSKVSTAIVPLMGLIDSLDKKSKETLKEQYDQLKAMKEGRAKLHNGGVEEIYRAVLTYLHRTYLSEVTRGIFPSSKLKTTKATPKPKQYDKTLPDGL